MQGNLLELTFVPSITVVLIVGTEVESVGTVERSDSNQLTLVCQAGRQQLFDTVSSSNRLAQCQAARQQPFGTVSSS